jgi:CRP-like cAMP-binding protein
MISVSKRPPFDPEAFLAKVEAGKTRTELRRRQIVFSQGDPADAVFSIRKGRIELKVLSPHGKEPIVAILDAGDFFGEGCLTGQPLRMATAAAITECTVMRIEKSAMVAVLRDEPDLAALFLAHLLSRNIRLEEDLVDHLFNSGKAPGAGAAAARRYRQGRETRSGDRQDQSGEPRRDGRHNTLARQLFMNKFRKLGFVAYNRGRLSVRSSLLDVLLQD